MKKLRIPIAITLVTLAILLAVFLRNQLRIDSCLDGGGAWDYNNKNCQNR